MLYRKKKSKLTKIISVIIMLLMIFQNLTVYAAPSDVVTLTDTNLEQAVRTKLGKATGDITQEDMATIDYLSIVNQPISNLSGLEYATNMNTLVLTGCGISDISNLSGLTSLTNLQLNNNNITTVSAISGLTNLTTLQLNNNKVSDISSLGALTNLDTLDLNNNSISDISTLSSLTKLKDLELTKNSISDISAFSGNTSLQTLNLGQNNISDISVISNLVNLKDLEIGNNHISDITPLALITALQRLEASENNITDLTPLTNQTNMYSLVADNNKITSVDPISNLVNLTGLGLANNKVVDVTPLSGMNKLKILGLQGNKITDITALAGTINPTMWNIDVAYNKIADISILSTVPGTCTVHCTGWVDVSAVDESGTVIHPEINASSFSTSNDINKKYSGISSTYDAIAIPFSDYDLDDTATKSITFVANNLMQSIFFHYKAKAAAVKGSTTIQYKDQDTGNLLEPQTVNSNLDLATYLYIAKTFTDYTLNDTSTKSVTLTAADKDQTVVFNYKKNVIPSPVVKGSYVVQYKDQDTGNLLESQTVKSDLDLSIYTENAKSFSGYTLNDLSSKTVILTDSTQKTIVFNYKQVIITPPVITAPVIIQPVVKGSYKVQYKDQDTGNLLEPETFKSDLDLGTYTETAKSFDGYNLNDDSSKTVVLTDSTTKILIFNYKKIVPKAAIKGSYKVSYIDESGNLLESETSHTDLELGTYTEQAKTFKGYKLNDESIKSVALTEANPNQSIVFKYNKVKGSYNVKYVNESGAPLDKEVDKTDLDLGTYTELAKSFSGYTLNDDSSKSVTLTQENPNQSIVFKYKLTPTGGSSGGHSDPVIKGSYVVRYIDESGNLLAPEISYKDLILGTYTENAKSFNVYSLNDKYTKSVTLTKENRNQVMEFRYTNGLYKVRYIDELGNLLEPETTHSNLLLGKYTEAAKSFKGYKLNDESSKSVTLADSNRKQLIEFKYNKIKGSYKVRYIDESGNLLEPETSHKDLNLAKYIEEAKSFEGYILNDENSKSVTLTEDNKDQVIQFKYNRIPGVTVLPQTGDTSKTDVTLILLILALGSLFFVLKKKQA